MTVRKLPLLLAILGLSITASAQDDSTPIYGVSLACKGESKIRPGALAHPRLEIPPALLKASSPSSNSTKVKYSIRQDGSTSEIEVLRSTDDQWSAAVVSGLSRWRVPCGLCPEGCPAVSVEQTYGYKLE